jgi:hypothetical protein
MMRAPSAAESIPQAGALVSRFIFLGSTLMGSYRSIFSNSTARQRVENFATYWVYTQQHDGELYEQDKDLSRKREILSRFRDQPVRARHFLVDPDAFYRNNVRLTDDLDTLDRRTALLTCIYKFTRHEWVGVQAAWDVNPSFAQSRCTIDKIVRYHLAEEFCHIRLFEEMFRTFHLGQVQWVPLGKLSQRVYRIFPRIPRRLTAPVGFVAELMGITFYMHTDRLLDELFADDTDARDHLRALLHEIMIDELAHIGQRRNFLGPVGIRIARRIVRPMIHSFFRGIPETKLLFDIDQMVRDALTFDYNSVPTNLLTRSWVPSYCRTAAAGP